MLLKLQAEPTVRLPPSRAKRASASLAEAVGGGGKPDTTCEKAVRLKRETYVVTAFQADRP